MNKFEVFRGRNGDYRWRLKASNNKVVAQSEGYTRHASAIKACSAAMKAAQGAKVVDLVKPV